MTTKLTQSDLDQFTGSENWYRHGINRKVLFTDGAKYVADQAGAYWLIDEIAFALASLGEAYEQLDEQSADRLERELFKPVQAAYGRAQRTYNGFAGRHELPDQQFGPAPSGAPSHLGEVPGHARQFVRTLGR